ncbi:MAG: YebC/PmpR family DNA-binding transcriptional regulator [Pseudomonadota bacterium]|jgi:YebC/PmpR family DNA-binding regulatory protein
MGRIFEKRKDRMFARWAKTAKAFTKLGKEIAISVKLGGGDPDNNPRLRMAIQTARSLNMPKDRIEAAIKRASSRDEAELAEISYEGYAPYGVAIFVEAATDNPTRTVANVRNIITKHGGKLATTGALDFVFDRKGVFKIATPAGDLDDFELEMIDYGLEEIFEAEDGLLLYSSFKQFGDLQKALEAKQVEVKSAIPQRLPTSYVAVTAEQEAEIQKMIDKLEDDDDVQSVFSNMQSSAE